MVAIGAGEWRLTGMHIDNHLDFVRDWHATLGIDGSANHDMTDKVPFGVVCPLELENLAKIDMGQDAVALGLRSFPEFVMSTLANLFPQIGEL